MTTAEKVLKHANEVPEGVPLAAKELLHLGNRAAVDQVLSRVTRRGVLTRVGRGIYLRPVKGRFGSRAPSTAKMVEGLAAQQRRDDRGPRCRCRKRIGPNDAGARARDLSHIRSQPSVESWLPGYRTTL